MKYNVLGNLKLQLKQILYSDSKFNKKYVVLKKSNLMNSSFKFISALCTLLIGSHAFGQYTDVINSNRPGASQSAFSVGTNVLQLEVGPYLIDENRSPYPSFETKGYGIDFALHYGFFKEAFEVNIQGRFQRDTKTYNSPLNIEEDRSNFKNLNLGIKYLIYDPNKNKEEKINIYSYHANRGFKWRHLIPAVAVSAGLNFDSKNNPYTSASVEGLSYRAALITQNNFYGGWVFVTNFMMDRISSDQQDFHYILTLTHSFSPKWVVFVEKHGIKSDFYADNLVRFGGGYLLSKDLQLDSAVTFNFKDSPSVFGLNFGVSYRIDRHRDEPKASKSTSVKKEEKRRARAQKRAKKKKVDNFDEN